MAIKDTIADVVFNDASQEGNEAGKKRTQEGKNKSPFRTVTETDLKTKAKFLIQGDSALDSFNKSYDDAYEIAMRAKNVSDVSLDHQIKNINNNYKTSSSMAKNDFRIERQIELLNQLLTSLNKTKSTVMATAGHYKKMYDSLGNTMLKNTVEEYYANYERTIKNIKKLVEEIDSIDIPFIKKEISWWESHH